MKTWLIHVARWRMLLILAVLVLGVRLLTGDVFLKTENLVNVARQISFEATIAFGMTLVIITGGIDLSVGSLVALTGVAAGWVMRRMFVGDDGASGGAASGAAAAWPAAAIIAAGIVTALTAGTLCGTLSGAVITRFAIPPFIVTLSLMLMARGTAFLLCGARPIYELPPELLYFGRGFVARDCLGPVLPVPVVVMLAVGVAFHILLRHTVIGREIVAVGSNEQASFFSGVNVRRRRLLVYILTGALCGVAGLLNTAKLMSADPKAGDMWELNVIAAVVVGGTSLFGGRGSIGGTLIGALIIGVLNNALNLMHVEDFVQRVIVGAVILAAALLDAALRKLEVAS